MAGRSTGYEARPTGTHLKNLNRQLPGTVPGIRLVHGAEDVKSCHTTSRSRQRSGIEGPLFWLRRWQRHREQMQLLRQDFQAPTGILKIGGIDFNAYKPTLQLQRRVSRRARTHKWIKHDLSG